MKLPTLTGLPKYRRFTFEPRYYDPIKEEVKIKENSARRMLHGADIEQNAENMRLMKDRIAGSFKRKSSDSKRSFLIQAVIAVGLTLLFLAILKF
jgi:hypothetical protein